MKKVLFIDRDGTLIAEPATDFQVDSLAKFRFVPGVIGALSRIAGLNYELVMATNQDGLGTGSFPKEDFWPLQELMMRTLEGEGVRFADVLVDRTFPGENAPTRKPRTGMFGRYLTGDYDLAASYVIGDRVTDIRLAANLGAQGILVRPRGEGEAMLREAGLTCALVTDDWAEIADFLRLGARTARVERTTRETRIDLWLDLDGGEADIATGLGFLDHMLAQIAYHGGIGLRLRCEGDLHVDGHHTIEDVAIALGRAVDRALGAKLGIARYGFALPMDDASALVLMDFGGRGGLEWNARFAGERIGDVPARMLRHFFRSFAAEARCGLHVAARGYDDHHKAEAIFKAFARSLRAAVRRERFAYDLPSSKGVL